VAAELCGTLVAQKIVSITWKEIVGAHSVRSPSQTVGDADETSLVGSRRHADQAQPPLSAHQLAEVAGNLLGRQDMKLLVAGGKLALTLAWALGQQTMHAENPDSQNDAGRSIPSRNSGSDQRCKALAKGAPRPDAGPCEDEDEVEGDAPSHSVRKLVAAVLSGLDTIRQLRQGASHGGAGLGKQ